MAEEHVVFDIKYIQLIPEFDGNNKILQRFTQNCDEIVNIFVDKKNQFNPVNKLILNSIKSKLRGRAAEVVELYGCVKWSDLKNLLNEHFGDQRSESALVRDLCTLVQGNQNTMEYFENVFTHLSLLCNYVDTFSSHAVYEKEKYKNLALDIFMNGLREPIGSIVRSSCPKTLIEAQKIIIREEKSNQFRQTQYQQTKNIMKTQMRPNSFNKPRFEQNQRFIPNYNQNTFTPRNFNNNFIPRRFNNNFAYKNYNQDNFNKSFGQNYYSRPNNFQNRQMREFNPNPQFKRTIPFNAGNQNKRFATRDEHMSVDGSHDGSVKKEVKRNHVNNYENEAGTSTSYKEMLVKDNEENFQTICEKFNEL